MLNFIYLVFVHYKKSIQPKDVQLLIETLLTLYGKVIFFNLKLIARPMPTMLSRMKN